MAGEKNYGRGGYIGSSSLEEEALATQGQPEQPCGLADFASAILIKAACVRETVEQNTRCQDRLILDGRWFSGRNHEGMDMWCSRN